MPGIYVHQPVTCTTRSIGGSSPKIACAPKSEKQWQQISQQLLPSLQKLLPILISSANHLPCQTQSSDLPIRPKQVTNPLSERLRAELFGTGINAERVVTFYGSSGSDHEPSSLCLAEMVHEFLEDGAAVGSCGHTRYNCGNDSCSDEIRLCDYDNANESIVHGQFCEILQGVVSSMSNSELRLQSDVNKIINENACKIDSITRSHGCFRRTVMTYLRLAGYNAAICKCKWENTGGFPAGDYEYLDVIMDRTNEKHDRLIVDLNFKAQFEIARASRQYNNLLQLLPAVFVGIPERLQHILKIMSDAVKHSLTKRGLCLPPWRKQCYLQAKWFSAYKRTTNEVAHTHQNSEDACHWELSSTALRGSRIPSKYTEELETPHALRLRDTCNGRNCGPIPFGADNFTRKQNTDPSQPLRKFCNVGNEAQEITVMSSDWQLPAVNPKNGGRVEMMSGLLSVLKEAGL